MRTNHPLAACLVIMGITCAAVTAQAEEHDKSTGKKQLSANEIIGKKVMNSQNDDLGKVQDLIVNFDSGNVPYAIVSGGFPGRSKVAVPLDALQCSADGKSFTLNASKEQFKAAAKTPSERWHVAENAEWARSVDGYYGQPSRERYDRQRVGETSDETRVFARDPSTIKGAERLLQPADRALCDKICEAIDNVQVDVNNGVAHLYGTVESDTARKNIETKVRAVSGVQRVESHLKVKNQ